MKKIKPRERTAIINSLRTGVVPKIGLQHIQVGRLKEVSEILKDLQEITDDSAKVRCIIGEFGSGKSFFLTLASIISHEKDFVSTKADISTEKILYSRDGKARALYSELINNLSIKTKPDGNALKSIIEK